MLTVEFTPEGYEGCRVLGWIHANRGSDLQDKPLPAVVICPGGAYIFVSDREAEPVAERYYAAGYNTFILYYSVLERAKNLEPLLQLAATLREIRRRSAEWYTLPEQIAVCGFSAGGHLACSAGTLTQTAEFKAAFGSEEPVFPNAMILSYPVITADEFAHVESIENVSGAPCGSPRYRWFGLDQYVNEQTPPTFLWHTAADGDVPVENSLRFAEALSKAKVPFEIHVYPYGVHGLASCTKEVGKPDAYVGRWIEESIAWLNDVFRYEH